MTVNKRRVVVTGLGTVCPVGNDVDTMWENIKNGVESMKLLILIQLILKLN